MRWPKAVENHNVFMRGKVSRHKQTHCTSQFKPCCKSHMWPKLRAMTLSLFTPLHPKRCIIFIREHHARYCQIKTAHNARKRRFCSFAHYASASTAMYSVCSGTFLSSFRGKKRKRKMCWSVAPFTLVAFLQTPSHSNHSSFIQHY